MINVTELKPKNFSLPIKTQDVSGDKRWDVCVKRRLSGLHHEGRKFDAPGDVLLLNDGK